MNFLRPDQKQTPDLMGQEFLCVQTSSSTFQINESILTLILNCRSPHDLVYLKHHCLGLERPEFKGRLCTEDKNIHFSTHNVILLPQNGHCLARRTNKTEQHCSTNCQVQTLKSHCVSKPRHKSLKALSKYSKHQRIIFCSTYKALFFLSHDTDNT